MGFAGQIGRDKKTPTLYSYTRIPQFNLGQDLAYLADS